MPPSLSILCRCRSIYVPDNTKDLDVMVTPTTGSVRMYMSVQNDSAPTVLPTRSTATWATTIFNATEIRVLHTEYVLRVRWAVVQVLFLNTSRCRSP
jgi:hypothetical protein